MQKILEISKPKVIEENKPADGGNGDSILSPMTGMKNAIEKLREQRRRTALATGSAYSSDEDDASAVGFTKDNGGNDKNSALVDADGAVRMDHNVMVYTTQVRVFARVCLCLPLSHALTLPPPTHTL